MKELVSRKSLINFTRFRSPQSQSSDEKKRPLEGVNKDFNNNLNNIECSEKPYNVKTDLGIARKLFSCQTKRETSSHRTRLSLEPRETTILEDDNEDEFKLDKSVTKALKRMTNQELVLLLTKDDMDRDEANIDWKPLIDKCPMFMDLQHERDNLSAKVIEMANMNYAREPEFVKDRLKLRGTLNELSTIKQDLTSKSIKPIIDHMNQIQEKLASKAKEVEETSENIASSFLDGSIDHGEFLRQYIDKRKDTTKRRYIADRLAREVKQLSENAPHFTGESKQSDNQPPKPAPRSRRRVSFF